MIKFERFTSHDSMRVKPLPVFFKEPWFDILANCDHKQTWTMVCGDQLLAIIGYQQIWKGTYQVWAIVDHNIKEHGVTATRALRRFIELGAKSPDVHRVQMTVKSGYQDGANWAVALGFEIESILLRYGTERENYELWVRHF